MTDERLLASRILIVDDKPANVLLLEKLLARWGYSDVVGTWDPRAALDLCAEIDPDLLLLDLSMPDIDGFEILDLLALRPTASVPMPVLVLTADTTVHSKHRALSCGARDFLTKPFDAEEVRLRVGNLLEVRRLQLDLEQHSETLEERVRERTADLELARLEVFERLSLAGEYRDDDTHTHARRIGELGARLADVLHVDARTVEQFRLAGMLHDIGKIAVPDGVLLKAGRLTVAERQIIQTHAEIGARILAGSRSELLQLAEEIARTHHERWDGTGYPAGLAGEEIPLAGRIVAVADVLDALTHERPYKDAWPLDRALAEIVAQRGRQFDPRVVDALLALDRSLLEAALAPDPAAGIRTALAL